jgi:hypothetical protein
MTLVAYARAVEGGVVLVVVKSWQAQQKQQW